MWPMFCLWSVGDVKSRACMCNSQCAMCTHAHTYTWIALPPSQICCTHRRTLTPLTCVFPYQIRMVLSLVLFIDRCWLLSRGLGLVWGEELWASALSDKGRLHLSAVNFSRCIGCSTIANVFTSEGITRVNTVHDNACAFIYLPNLFSWTTGDHGVYWKQHWTLNFPSCRTCGIVGGISGKHYIILTDYWP